MKLFPHLIARVGGMKFPQLNQLSFGEMEHVYTLLENERAATEQFEKVLEEFNVVFEKTTDYRQRAILNNARKDFRKLRFSFFKKIEKNIIESKDSVFVKALLQNAKEFESSLKELELGKNNFQHIFQKDFKRQLALLQKWSANDDFQKSLLQSSQTLFQRVPNFQQKPVSDFRKKEMQVARTLAQYFMRMATKTSPFSYFTTLEHLKLKDGFFQNEKWSASQNLVQYNNFLFAEIKSLLLQNPDFYQHLKLRWNSSARVEEDDFLFLKNERNVETIQRVEASEVLLLLRNIIFTKNISFEKLLDELTESIEAEREDLAHFVLEIIDSGLINWNWKVSGLAQNWENLMLQKLNEFPAFEEKEKWISFFEKLKNYKNEYSTGDSTSRFFIQKEIHATLKNIGFAEVQNELVFMEDVRTSSGLKISEEKINPIVQSLDSLLRLLEPLAKNEMQDKINFLWKNYFEEQEEIPLLGFYEKLYSVDFSKQNFQDSKRSELIVFWKKELTKIVEIDEQGNFDFSTKKLAEHFHKTDAESEIHYSALLQFFEKENKNCAVLNGLSTGYGKLFGRFLPLFEKDVTIHLQKWNKNLQGEKLWIENVDASIYNANMHPPLLEKEIKIPNGQNNLPQANQIPINELYVFWNKKRNRPMLRHELSGKEISIFDFGFEHPDNRSPMFQLLNGFGKVAATHRLLLEIVNEELEDLLEKRGMKKGAVKVFPRITIDNHLVIQRRTQRVTALFFPKKEKGRSAAEYFLTLQQWRETNGINRFFFLRALPNTSASGEKRSRDFYKPQFIDLQSPFVIVLLEKTLMEHDGQFELSEMLPTVNDFYASERVQEVVVQW